jgi:hypothetical protein
VEDYTDWCRFIHWLNSSHLSQSPQSSCNLCDCKDITCFTLKCMQQMWLTPVSWPVFFIDLWGLTAPLANTFTIWSWSVPEYEWPLLFLSPTLPVSWNCFFNFYTVHCEAWASLDISSGLLHKCLPSLYCLHIRGSVQFFSCTVYFIFAGNILPSLQINKDILSSCDSRILLHPICCKYSCQSHI